MKIQRIIQLVLVLTLLVGAIASVAHFLAPAQTASAAQPAVGQTMAGLTSPTGTIVTIDGKQLPQPCVGWNS